MNRLLGSFVCGIVVMLFSSSVLAACGGGGWHSTSRTSNSSDRSSDSNQAQNVSYSQPSTSTVAVVSSRSLDTSRFDAVSSRLDLTDRQYRDLDYIRRDIRAQSAALNSAYNRAQNNLARCSGDCSDEFRRVERTGDALKAFNPDREFERRLNEVLTDQQMSRYRASRPNSSQSTSRS